ncbi:DEAD/DEAH box helicase [Halobacillus litoralis]|uniref:DEAD/DEAH box helicase n=1 Tax=Halobacillus litoralis TaxID=45668 RepID=A0A845DYV6_9BACI|nr:DEAD/DEAH box helicase family protein [Halobacillus litoralis]MYL21999.1 DEAD/DEAH box helicase [Halobacillus litoralis]
MVFLLPTYINLREYQRNAIQSWYNNSQQGLLEMATGTGKTITALAIAADLFSITKRTNIIIVTPFNQLSTQWIKECRDFGLRPVKAYGDSKKWTPHLDDNLRAFKKELTNITVTVTTNATFSLKPMQERLRRMSEETLIIVDEAHYFGAKNLNSKLPKHFKYRLALSATPTRWMDEEGTDRLISYFGNKVVYSFSLKEAIKEGYLTEYYYYPRLVHLNDEETEDYIELTNKIKKLYHQSKSNSDAKESMERLALKRARIIYSAHNKVEELTALLKKSGSSSHSLFYCGDGQYQEQRQVDAITELLSTEFKMNAKRFTSKESNMEREELLSSFESGETEALVAIKCLDEGIDVPATKTAYLIASSGNPKEFIQRRGRVLRKHPDKKYAVIHDFIVVPPNLEEISTAQDEYYNMVRNQLKKEFHRFREFSNLAINGPEAEEVIWELKKEFNLLDV